MSGTRMAAPYVAAAAAMVREEHGFWDAGDIRVRHHGGELSSLHGKIDSGERLNVNKAFG